MQKMRYQHHQLFKGKLTDEQVDKIKEMRAKFTNKRMDCQGDGPGGGMQRGNRGGHGPHGMGFGNP